MIHYKIVSRVVMLDGTWHMLLVMWNFSYMTGMWTLPAGAQIRYPSSVLDRKIISFINTFAYNETYLFYCS